MCVCPKLTFPREEDVSWFLNKKLTKTTSVSNPIFVPKSSTTYFQTATPMAIFGQDFMIIIEHLVYFPCQISCLQKKCWKIKKVKDSVKYILKSSLQYYDWGVVRESFAWSRLSHLVMLKCNSMGITSSSKQHWHVEFDNAMQALTWIWIVARSPPWTLQLFPMFF